MTSPSPASGAPHVRPATAADAPALAAQRWEFRARLGPTDETEPAFLARCTAWMHDRLTAGGAWHAWVAERDGAVLGTIWVGRVEKMPNPTPEPEAHAYVTNVYVRPDARGGGIGTRLLEAALAWCESADLHAAILWPPRRSAALYERHGFARPDAPMEREFGPGPDRDAD
jgi:GNAT superfamily N-acetyltransferase